MVLPHLATLPEAASPAHWYQLMAARRRGERHPHTAALPEAASPAHWYQLMDASWRETPSHRSARPTEPGLTPAMPRQRELGTSCPATPPRRRPWRWPWTRPVSDASGPATTQSSVSRALTAPGLKSPLLGELGGEPVEALVQAVALRGTRCLDVPLTSPQRV